MASSPSFPGNVESGVDVRASGFEAAGADPGGWGRGGFSVEWGFLRPLGRDRLSVQGIGRVERPGWEGVSLVGESGWSWSPLGDTWRLRRGKGRDLMGFLEREGEDVWEMYGGRGCVGDQGGFDDFSEISIGGFVWE